MTQKGLNKGYTKINKLTIMMIIMARHIMTWSHEYHT